MKKYIITAFAFFTLLTGSVTFTACEDIEDVKELNLNSLLSPTHLTARVREKVNIEISWDAMDKAESYVIEVFKEDPTFAGTPVLTFETATTTYTVTGLEGETSYSIRVKAVAEGIGDSKWVSITRSTEAENIFQNVTEADLTFSSVTLHWPAGATATSIILTPADVPAHTLTAEELQAGAATITGLKSEVTYTALLKNGEKTRGTISFTTLVDEGTATGVKPTDNFVEILANANNGDEFAFYPGTYDFTEKININKSIVIKALKPGERPIIKGYIALNEGASLTMRQIIMDGEGKSVDASHVFDFKTATNYNSLILEDCEIRNYTKGLYYVNVAATIDKITINNCLMHNIECSGADMFDCRAGAIKEINLTNSTVYKSCAARDFLRYDDKSSSFPGITPTINVENCTFDGICNAPNRILYIRFKGHSIVFKNNLVTNTVANFSNQSSTNKPTFDKNNYFNAPNLKSGPVSGVTIFDTEATVFDPGYANATDGNFTVSNQNIKDFSIGDPRWRM